MFKSPQRSKYDVAWQELYDEMPGDNREYLSVHKERHWETFDTVARLVQHCRAPKILEVGTSPFIRLYRKLIPNASLTTIDRPEGMLGMTAETALEWGALRHYGVDLTTTPLGPDLGEPPTGLYDAVAFCEILEHLPLSATQLFSELFSLLEPDGNCYIMTPNSFALTRLRKVFNRENPQEAFQARGADKWAATHVREYSMSELFEAIDNAGGKVVRALYSNCWEDGYARDLLAETPALLSNLAIVAVPLYSPHAPDSTVSQVKLTFGALNERELAIALPGR